MEFVAKWTENLQSKIYEDAISIRHTVFVEEQKVPVKLEIDELEAESLHIVLYDAKQKLATARILELENNIYKVQRVAVLKEFRKQGVGAALMNEIELKVRQFDGQKLTLGSQNSAIPFYEKFGYDVVSPEFMDAGIPHHTMTKTL